MGFGSHHHENMEIISYVIEGALEHKDSMGTGSVIRRGEIQRMSAGTGIKHSELNYSSSAPVHFLQIWIIPEKNDIKPSYQQELIPQKNNQLILIASGQDIDGVIKIHQNIQMYVSYLQVEQTLDYNFAVKHCGWLQLIKGSIVLNDQHLLSGDGAAILDNNIVIKSTSDAEFLLFDLLAD